MTPLVAKLALLLASVATAVQASCAEPSSTPRSRPGAQAPAAPTGVAPREELQAAAAAINRNRAGCVPLAWDDAAARIAQAHSDDMARRGYFAHLSPEGRGVAERLRAQGVAYSAVAENLAQGYGRGDDVVRGWMGSAGHRRNIQWCAVTRMGLGARDGLWTLVLYTPRG